MAGNGPLWFWRRLVLLVSVLECMDGFVRGGVRGSLSMGMIVVEEGRGLGGGLKGKGVGNCDDTSQRALEEWLEVDEDHE